MVSIGYAFPEISLSAAGSLFGELMFAVNYRCLAVDRNVGDISIFMRV